MSLAPWSIYVGWEPREASAYAVATHSIKKHCFRPMNLYGLVLDDLRAKGLYWRPTEKRQGLLYDVISEHPMATEFACSRFLVPYLAGTGFALFMDCDMLVRKELDELFDGIDPQYAVSVVKHDFNPFEHTKMDGQVQSRYARKNWSSVMVFNCDHPSNKKLTVDLVNALPGRELHRFAWLEDDEIGALDPKWNWLAGHSDPKIDPGIVHHTDGAPCMAGYENAPYADEWRSVLNDWALGALSLPG